MQDPPARIPARELPDVHEGAPAEKGDVGTPEIAADVALPTLLITAYCATEVTPVYDVPNDKDVVPEVRTGVGNTVIATAALVVRTPRLFVETNVRLCVPVASAAVKLIAEAAAVANCVAPSKRVTEVIVPFASLALPEMGTDAVGNPVKVAPLAGATIDAVGPISPVPESVTDPTEKLPAEKETVWDAAPAAVGRKMNGMEQFPPARIAPRELPELQIALPVVNGATGDPLMAAAVDTLVLTTVMYCAMEVAPTDTFPKERVLTDAGIIVKGGWTVINATCDDVVVPRLLVATIFRECDPVANTNTVEIDEEGTVETRVAPS